MARRPDTVAIMGDVRTVGVEEELLIVDPTGVPVPLGPAALAVASRRGPGKDVEEHDRAERTQAERDPAAHLVPELKEQQLELGTRVCDTLDEVAGELRFWRGRAEAAANEVGASIAALATSPVAVHPVQTAGERYQRLLDRFGRTAEEVLTCGCHVHVSVADDEEGVAVLNMIRIWLPVLTALSANSPFWQGADTGYASFRSQVWHRWPTAGATEVFADAAEYHRLIEAVLATDTVLDTGMVYFDARLSEKWPTVEIRTADVALRVEDAVTLAGLVRGLVETAARETCAGQSPPAVPAAVLRAAGWRAGRSGVTGALVHPLTGRPAPAEQVVAALVDHVREALSDAGDDEAVREGVAAILRRGTGADLQRRVHRESGGDLRAVVRAAADLTTAQATASLPG
jgi:carboxylate-amine ligase